MKSLRLPRSVLAQAVCIMVTAQRPGFPQPFFFLIAFVLQTSFCLFWQDYYPLIYRSLHIFSCLYSFCTVNIILYKIKKYTAQKVEN